MTAVRSQLDPFLVGAVAKRLVSTLNEQQATLVNTAFSTIVRESLDLACGVFDTRGEMVAQSASGTPGHINAMATGVHHFLARFPAEQLAPGDVLITNDPWMTTGQLHDITIATPVFRAERLVALFASTCHAADIGGRGLSGEAREVYEEGLLIPPMKLVRAGAVNEDLVELIRGNVRTPDETIGDVYAQAAANATGARSLLSLLDELHLDGIDEIGAEIIDRSERAMREAIAALPDGVHTAEVSNDGFDEPVTLRVTITIDGDDVRLDFDGSSGQSQFGINNVLNYTRAYASFALKAAVAPDVPHNAGSFRPVEIVAPEGSILNCRPPAAVASRHLIGHMLPSLVFAALAPVLPERLLAGSADSLWATLWRGVDAGGDSFAQTLFHAGGVGARAMKDGLSTVGFPTGVGAVATEVVEALTPLLNRSRTLRTDSAGPGWWRGGLGQVVEMECRGQRSWNLSALVDRTRFPAQGAAGGLLGAPGELTLDGDWLPTKRLVALDRHACVTVRTPGGGGWGDPLLRDPARVLADVVDGYVSLLQARKVYGVAIDYVGAADARVRLPQDYVVDQAETARLRGDEGSLG
ncbi:MAG: hydantoinase B/oxoprolinase family protein [Actinobacteria bacterium]|nr:hydantoinase B/oxoprolinase family protein [Actinomycetota bacterium]